MPDMVGVCIDFVSLFIYLSRLGDVALQHEAVHLVLVALHVLKVSS